MLTCPTCRHTFLALFACHDGRHRCWSCRETLPPPAPGAYASPNITRQTPEAAAMRAIRRKIRKIEADPKWQRSPRAKGRHEAYADCVGLLGERGAGENA